MPVPDFDDEQLILTLHDFVWEEEEEEDDATEEG